MFTEQEASARALAIRALENDLMVINGLSESNRALVSRQQQGCGLDIDLHVADTKYTFLHEQCKQIRCSQHKLSHSFTQKADQIIINKWVGIPFFFAVMYLMICLGLILS